MSAFGAVSTRSARGTRWDLVACALLGAIVAWISIGDFRVRMANTILDDNPVVFAHFLADQGLFTRDVLSTYGEVFGKATIQNWLPAIMLDRFGIDPHFPSLVFVVLQHVLLSMALYLLAMDMTGHRRTAWTTVVFALAALPWRWNLAGYGSIMPWPYPGHLVVPLLLFSVSALLRRRWASMMVLLIAASLVHPAMTLCGVAVIGLFLLDEWRAERRPASLLHMAMLTVPVLVSIAPALLMTSGVADQVSQSELMAVLRANGHMNPLRNFRFMTTALPTFIGYCVLVLLALRSLPPAVDAGNSRGRVRSLCLAAAAALVILSTLHALAMWIGIPRVAQIAGTRSSLLFVMITLPIALHFLLQRIESVSFAERWAAAAVLLLLAVQQFGLFVGPLAALLLFDLQGSAAGTNGHSLQDRRALHRAGAIVLVVWVVLVIGAGAIGIVGGETVSGRPLLAVLAPGTYLGAGFAVTAVLITSIAFLPSLLDRLRIPGHRPQATTTAIALMLVVIAAGHTYRTGQETRLPLSQANYAAQRWAREHTGVNALFVIAEPDLPWRTASLRNAVRMEPDAFYIYSGSAVAKRQYHDLPIALNDAYRGNSAGRILAFAQSFDADFIVGRRSLNLGVEPVYRNDVLAIYPMSGSAARTDR